MVARRLTDYRLFVYGAEAYLAAAAPFTAVSDLHGASFVGYIEDMLFARELNYLGALEPAVSARAALDQPAGPGPRDAERRRPVHPAGLHRGGPSRAGDGPAGAVSLTRSFHMHIHEDHRKAAHIRAVAGFIAGEVEGAGALFAGPAV